MLSSLNGHQIDFGNINNLPQIFECTFSNSNELRHNAEQALQKFETTPSFTSRLLQLVHNTQIDLTIRLAVSIRLKNIVREKWALGAEYISEDDRRTIKLNLFDVIVAETDEKIRRQLLDLLYRIATCDFPDYWPELMDKVMSNLTSSEIPRMLAALQCLAMILRRYQYLNPLKLETRPQTPVLQIVEATFPHLLTIIHKALKWDDDTKYDLVRLVLKCVCFVTQLELPEHIGQPKAFREWISAMVSIVTVPVTTDHLRHFLSKRREEGLQGGVQADDFVEYGRQIPIVKCQKWSAKLLLRFFEKFGRPKCAQSEFIASFAEHFMAEYSLPILEQFMQVLKNYKEGHYVGHRILVSVYQYLTYAVSFKALYAPIRKHFGFVVFECAFRTVCLNRADVQMFQDDPHEFIRQNSDFCFEFRDPRITAAGFLIELVRVRTSSALPSIVTAMEQILDGFAKSDADKKDHIRKEGAMNVLGILSKPLMNCEQTKNVMEGVLGVHVIPEFKSNIGFMRSRACWTFSQFHLLNWKDSKLHYQGVTALLGALSDQELPVQIEAANSIGRVILPNPGSFGKICPEDGDIEAYSMAVNYSPVLDLLEPHIPMILESLFRMINELGSEAIVQTFDILIDRFGEKIAPWATEIARKMVGIFLELYTTELEGLDDDNMGNALASVSCMKALNTLLYSCSSNNAVIREMEMLLRPIFDQLMNEDGVEFLEDIFEMMFTICYYSAEISPYMWSLLPRVCEAGSTYAIDFMVNIMPLVDNYIQKGSEVFASSQQPNFVELVISLCQKILQSEAQETGDQDGGRGVPVEFSMFAARILQDMLQACAGRIDRYVPVMLTLAMQKIAHPQHECVKLEMYGVLASAAFHNPATFIEVCKKNDWVNFVFNTWLSHLPPHHKKMDWPQQKTSVIGLASLLKLPVSSLPEQLLNGFPRVMSAMVELTLIMNDEPEFEEIIDEQKELEPEPEPQSNSLIDVPDDQDFERDDGGYVHLLAKLNGELEDLDVCSFADENNELRAITAPIDPIEEVIYLCERLDEFAQHSSDFYKQWLAMCPKEHLTRLQQLLVRAKQDHEEYLERKKRGEQKKQVMRANHVATLQHEHAQFMEEFRKQMNN
eukprot:92323_1